MTPQELLDLCANSASDDPPWAEITRGIEAWADVGKALAAAQADARREREEVARLHAEARSPVCHECGAVLGDNWCGKCAGRAAQERADALAAQLDAANAALAECMVALDDAEKEITTLYSVVKDVAPQVDVTVRKVALARRDVWLAAKAAHEAAIKEAGA